MGRFIGGVLLGVLLGGGGVYLWLSHRSPAPLAQAPAVTEPPVDDGKTPGKKKRRRATVGTSAGNGLMAPEGGDDDVASGPAPPPLSEADLRMVAEGDAIRPRPVEVDLAAGGDGPRALSGSEINDTVQGRHAGLEQCLVAARQNDEVHARISVSAVVGPDGRVTAVRVEAPAILQRRGLAGCLRGQFKSMHFPTTGRDNVITVPFSLD